MENARLLGELRGRTHDLQESLEYQTATSDVLKVISQSGAELEPVLETLVETAARICEADKAVIHQLRDGMYRMAASSASRRNTRITWRATRSRPDRGTLTVGPRSSAQWCTSRTRRPTPNTAARSRSSSASFARCWGCRCSAREPSWAVIFLARSRVEPFTEKQIALVTTFADQAVIAIENARLFNELRARTAELGRSVEELKMLSEVGQAVSSTLDLRAVLSTILTRSVGLTGAEAGVDFPLQPGRARLSLCRGGRLG